MDNLKNKILELKKNRDVVILGHYYVDKEVQDICDYVGDSYFLAKKATEIKNKTIMFCGVRFMAESAKILNPDKTVLLVNDKAICPMAAMVTKADIDKIRGEYDDVTVVCYINSKSEIKRYVDVCITSGNAMKVIEKITSEYIYFIPDKNLGAYLAKQFPDKKWLFHPGYCPLHDSFKKEDVLKAKQAHPDSLVLAHPECSSEVLDLADYVGSTSGIISYVKASPAAEFIIASEFGMFYELEKENPTKKFHTLVSNQVCEDMKKITLDLIVDVLENDDQGVILDEDLINEAKASLDKMLEMAK